MTGTAVIAHAIIAVAIVIAYAVVTSTGHDGNGLLILLGGQGIGVVTQKAADSVTTK